MSSFDPEEDDDDWDYHYVFGIIGECSVGKTSLTTRFSAGCFEDVYDSTLGKQALVF